ncbi:MAG: gluconokinase [Anaerolineae bacterium]|jgi:gluconokinase|nr:gluconokinase [Anaerolineae bacterium]
MIGLDLGTTNCKAVLLDASGQVRAKASESYKLLVPRPGWAEQDVRLMWGAATRVLRAVAASEAAADPDILQGISICGAMHSLFPVADEAGTPISNAMTWADARATAVYRGLIAEANVHAIYRRTGCPVHSTYHLQRLRWWDRVEPEQFEAAHLWVGLKDWILHALTGCWATDLSLASTTGLLNLRDLTWDTEALQLAGVRSSKLPPLVSTSTVVGGLTHEAAALTGLPAGLPVIAGASDGATACLGTGIATPGQTVITVGTSGAVRKVVDEPWFDSGERTWCYILSDRPERPLWIIGGAINNGGLTLQWAREKLYPDFEGADGYAQLAADAASVPPGAGGVFMLPYFAGERSPHWAPRDRAMMYGLGMAHNRAHFARAALEGVANCLADVWDALYGSPRDEQRTNDGKSAAQVVRLTGGITRTPFWAQILADMLGVPLMALDVADTSATGAALLGMNALGLIGANPEQSSGQIAATVAPGPVYSPDPERHQFYNQHHREHKALRRGMAAMGEALDNLRESYR